MPLTPPVSKTAEKSLPHETLRTKKRQTILLVEDNDELRGMFRTALVVAGFHVQEAADGYDALRLLEEENPALVVLDLRLPLVDGREVLEEMREQQKRIPVVIVTAADDTLAGVDVQCVLRKPVTQDRLVETVTRCLSK